MFEFGIELWLTIVTCSCFQYYHGYCHALATSITLLKRHYRCGLSSHTRDISLKSVRVKRVKHFYASLKPNTAYWPRRVSFHVHSLIVCESHLIDTDTPITKTATSGGPVHCFSLSASILCEEDTPQWTDQLMPVWHDKRASRLSLWDIYIYIYIYTYMGYILHTTVYGNCSDYQGEKAKAFEWVCFAISDKYSRLMEASWYWLCSKLVPQTGLQHHMVYLTTSFQCKYPISSIANPIIKIRWVSYLS